MTTLILLAPLVALCARLGEVARFALVFAGVAVAAVHAQAPAPAGTQAGPAGGPGGFVAYPQRPPGDPAAIERGKAAYGVNCAFCHGPDARGGDGGGPNLLRSTVVLDDQRGELIAPIIQNGRGSMPPFQLTVAHVGDIAAFLHSFEVGGNIRTIRTPINILVGDARKGEAYVQAKCASCHTVAALRAFAVKLDDAKVLQQMWLMPGSGGRGAPPPIPAPPISVTVTLPTGEKVRGTLDRVDDFVVSLVQPDGHRRAFRTAGTVIKVDIEDPLKPHKDLLRTYVDSDIHNVTAYLVSLRQGL